LKILEKVKIVNIKHLYHISLIVIFIAKYLTILCK